MNSLFCLFYLIFARLFPWCYAKHAETLARFVSSLCVSFSSSMDLEENRQEKAIREVFINILGAEIKSTFFFFFSLLKFKEECVQTGFWKKQEFNSSYQFITFAISNTMLFDRIRPQDYGCRLSEVCRTLYTCQSLKIKINRRICSALW